MILEGELIDNIIFVKDGRLSLEVTIDLNEPYKSIYNYFKNNFVGISRKEEINTNNNNIKTVNSLLQINSKNFTDLKNELNNFLLDNQETVCHKNYLLDANGISMDLGRLNFSGNINEETNFHDDKQLIKK